MYKIFLILIFSIYNTSSVATNLNDHKIAVLVNDQLITTYDIVQRMKMNAILSGMEISSANNTQLVNKITNDLIEEKLKNEKINEYSIAVEEEEYMKQEILYYNNAPFNKEELSLVLDANNIQYKEFEQYLAHKISWQKLVSGMYYRLTSTSNIEIEEVLLKNPKITEESAKNIIIQKQLELKSSKMIRDMFNEATIEYK